MQTTSSSRTDGQRQDAAAGKRFLRDRSGSTAIEFAILALPFFLLTFAIIESCVSFASQQLMANAADEVARELRTGQIRSLTKDELEDLVCDRMQILVSAGCPGLVVDLRQFDRFADAAAVRTILTADKDLDDGDFKVQVGGPGSKNMLRVFYKWPVMTDIMRKSMSTLKDGKTLHFASVTWQNEPFGAQR